MITEGIMDLTILSAISIVGIMIAINSEGKGRIAFSWLLVTILLVGNGIVIGNFLKEHLSAQNEATYTERLAAEKENIEKSLAVTDIDSEIIEESALKSEECSQLLEIIVAGEEMVEALVLINLDDYTISEENRAAEASSMKQKAITLKSRYLAVKPKLIFYRDATIAKSLDKLIKSAENYKLYYSAADSDQEREYEKAMRVNATASKELFLKSKHAIEAMK